MTNSGHQRNRKLLVSVFNPQEAREAVLGGARIVDAEDPKSALGNISPRQIMAISDAVLNCQRDLEVQLSTNIGEDQLLFDRSESGEAIQKSPYEIAGKAAQAAIGVSCAMGNLVHPCNLVKVGVDGMDVKLVTEVLREVVLTLNRTEDYSHAQVMSVLFAQDLSLWNQRKQLAWVRRELISHREFHYSEERSEDVFDLMEHDFLVRTLRSRDGEFLYPSPREVPGRDRVLLRLKQEGVLPQHATTTTIRLNELFSHRVYFPDIDTSEGRTNKAVIKAMVDATADAGADSIMIDTSILTKVCRISLVDTSSEGLVDLNALDESHGTPRGGILSLEELRFFVDYCHYRGVEANLAGSLESYHAQQLWLTLPEVDQMSTRGGSTAVQLDPFSRNVDVDTRQYRVTRRHLVRGLVPPEQGGIFNIPERMARTPEQLSVLSRAYEMLNDARASQGFDRIGAFVVDPMGTPRPLNA